MVVRKSGALSMPCCKDLMCIEDLYKTFALDLATVQFDQRIQNSLP